MIATATLSLAVLAGLLGTARWAVWRGFKAPRQPHPHEPAQFGLPARAVQIPTVDGKMLFAWHLAPPGAAPGPAVAVLHGWGANAGLMLPLAAPLWRAGYGLLLLDARNHGQSDGDSFSSMPRFAEDLEAGLDWLAAQPETDPARLAALGHSVGGAAALLAASRRPGRLAAVISLSAFDHPERVMRAYLRRAFIPYWPLGWLVSRYVERIIGHRFDRIAPTATIAAIRCPVLIGHGALDSLVPPDAAQAIHARRAGDWVELDLLDGTGHDEPVCYDTLGARLVTFLDRTLSRPRPPG